MCFVDYVDKIAPAAPHQDRTPLPVARETPKFNNPNRFASPRGTPGSIELNSN